MTQALLMQVIAQEASRLKTKPQDVFKALTYTGNAAARTVAVGLNLTGAGSMVWASPRNGSYDQFWASNNIDLSPNTNEADFSSGDYGPVVAATGFTLTAGAPYNENTVPYMSWSFKKAARFFTTVEYTGNGSSGRTLSHDLGATPGMVVIKRRDTTSNWAVWHRGATAGHYLQLNADTASSADTTRFNAAPSATQLTLGTSTDVNANGGSYIAYVFGHDPRLMLCGAVTVSGGAATVELGFEPQYLLLKGNMASANWNVMDTARGWGTGSPKTIRLNGGGTEYSTDSGATKTSSGFTLSGLTDGVYLYQAIRKDI